LDSTILTPCNSTPRTGTCPTTPATPAPAAAPSPISNPGSCLDSTDKKCPSANLLISSAGRDFTWCETLCGNVNGCVHFSFGTGSSDGICYGCGEVTLESDHDFDTYDSGACPTPGPTPVPTPNPNANPTATPTICPTEPPSSEPLFVCQNILAGTWAAHAAYAGSNNGKLLSVLNQGMTTYLQSAFGTRGKYWIGFNDIDSEGTWVWDDGSTTCYENWGTNSPSNSGSFGEDCAEYLAGEQGKWNDLNCGEDRFALYQFPMSEYQAICSLYECQPGPGNTLDQACGPTPSPTPSEPLFVCQIGSTKSWEDHKDSASSSNGQLLSVLNQEMTTYLQSEFGTDGNYWIGFNDKDVEGTWVWDDGSNVSYENWTGGQPDNHGGGEDCAEYLAGEAGKWNDRSCSTNREAYYQFPMSEYLNVCGLSQYECKPGLGNTFTQTCPHFEPGFRN